MFCLCEGAWNCCDWSCWTRHHQSGRGGWSIGTNTGRNGSQICIV